MAPLLTHSVQPWRVPATPCRHTVCNHGGCHWHTSVHTQGAVWYVAWCCLVPSLGEPEGANGTLGGSTVCVKRGYVAPLQVARCVCCRGAVAPSILTFCVFLLLFRFVCFLCFSCCVVFCFFCCFLRVVLEVCF